MQMIFKTQSPYFSFIFPIRALYITLFPVVTNKSQILTNAINDRVKPIVCVSDSLPCHRPPTQVLAPSKLAIMTSI